MVFWGFVMTSIAMAGAETVRRQTGEDLVDFYVADQLKKQNIPGLSLAVVRSGRIIKASGYGLAHIELNVPATPETVYQLASVTKPFTASAIMLLVGEGKVQLADPIAKYWEIAPPAWNNITVRHLLAMTTGIRDYLLNQPANEHSDVKYNFERMLGLVSNLPLDFQPGEKYSYSNSNFILLAMIIEKVTGKSYDAFLAERVFGPLGMTATRRDNPDDVISNRAGLYDWRDNKFNNAPFLNPTLWNNGDGGVLSTVIDLAKWDAALYGNTILSAIDPRIEKATAKKSKQQDIFRSVCLFSCARINNMRETMWTPGRLNNGKTPSYGLGWQTGLLRGHRWVGHSGGRPGTAANIKRFLDDELTVIVLANACGKAADISLHIAGMYIPNLTLSSIKEGADPEPELTQRLKECLFDLAEKRDSVLIQPLFRKELNKTDEPMADLQKRLKNLKSFTFVTTENPLSSNLDNATVRSCSYKLTSGDDVRFYTFELTADNRVAWCHSVSD